MTKKDDAKIREYTFKFLIFYCAMQWTGHPDLVEWCNFWPLWTQYFQILTDSMMWILKSYSPSSLVIEGNKYLSQHIKKYQLSENLILNNGGCKVKISQNMVPRSILRFHIILVLKSSILNSPFLFYLKNFTQKWHFM